MFANGGATAATLSRSLRSRPAGSWPSRSRSASAGGTRPTRAAGSTSELRALADETADARDATPPSSMRWPRRCARPRVGRCSRCTTSRRGRARRAQRGDLRQLGVQAGQPVHRRLGARAGRRPGGIALPTHWRAVAAPWSRLDRRARRSTFGPGAAAERHWPTGDDFADRGARSARPAAPAAAAAPMPSRWSMPGVTTTHADLVGSWRWRPPTRIGLDVGGRLVDRSGPGQPGGVDIALLAPLVTARRWSSSSTRPPERRERIAGAGASDLHALGAGPA